MKEHLAVQCKRAAYALLPLNAANGLVEEMRYISSVFSKFIVGKIIDSVIVGVICYVAMAVTQCLSGVMRGAGDTMTPMWISLATTVAIRVPLAYGIAYLTRSPELPNGAYQSLWISLLASWVLGAIITVICYKRGGWKRKALQRAGTDEEIRDYVKKDKTAQEA